MHKDKNAVITALTNPATLASFLRGIRIRENYEVVGDERRLTTWFSAARIKHLDAKIEEV
mgnify:CR=1 FL=1